MGKIISRWDTYPHQPSLWCCYIYDCVMIWCLRWEKQNEFINHLNSCHPTIKFTAQMSDNEVNFLNMTVHLEKDGSLWTDLHCKLTDSHYYLLFFSAHPHHCKKRLPYSQFLRVKRICTRNKDFIKHSLKLVGQFKRRGYPDDLINGCTHLGLLTKQSKIIGI